MDDERACIVMTTLGSEAEAEGLAVGLVEARLAACVQIQPIRSVYAWKGALQREPEWLLMIKTLKTRYAAVEAFIQERHPYETPEIVCVPIIAAASGYMRWLEGGASQA